MYNFSSSFWRSWTGQEDNCMQIGVDSSTDITGFADNSLRSRGIAGSVPRNAVPCTDPHESLRLRVAVRVRRGVAAFQSHLVRAQAIELDEEPFI